MDAERKISILPFTLILLLFLGSNVLDVLHYPQSDPNSGPLYRLHPLTYFLFLFWFIEGIRKNAMLHFNQSTARWYAAAVLLVFVYSVTLGKSKANFFILDTLFAPVLLIHLLQNATETFKTKLLFWIKVFFIFNCTLAIAERAISTIIFKPDVEAVFESFRSYGMLGHPLNNGLVTAFLTLFFMIISESTVKKFFYLGVGILAIFAFGARTALAAVFLAFPFILYFELKFYERQVAVGKFFNYLLLFFLMLGFCFFVLTSTSLGERIFASSKFDDDSADVRSRVFDMFRHFSTSDLMTGIAESEILKVMYLERVDIIENFWIIWIFKYGFVLTILLGIFLLLLLSSLFQNLDAPTRYVLIFVFFLIASGNNSLATNTTAVSIITVAALAGFDAHSNIYKFDEEYV